MLPYRENIEELLDANRMRVFITHREEAGNWVSEHWHPYFELLYILDGEAEQTVNGRKISLKQGDVLLISSGAVHATIALKEESYISAIIFSYQMPLPSYYLSNEKCTRMKRMFSEIQKEEKIKEKGYQFMEQGLLYQILGLLKRYGTVLEIQQNESNEGKRIEDYIRTHLTEEITLQKVAEFAGYSVPYLSRQFPKIMGNSFKNYIDKMKMQAACGMLEDDFSVTQIAETFCYDTASSFGRAFKRIVGKTPSEYQKIKQQKMDISG